MDFLALLWIGVGAFAATNIDDLFILMLFFSDKSFPNRSVVIGQYLGIGILIAISAVGSLLPLVISPFFIPLLGFVPIAIGIQRLLKLRKPEELPKHQPENIRRSNLSIISVASVTFANGGDNIGIYTPLFAKYSGILEVTGLVSIFLIMTAVWVLAAYYLVSHPAVADRLHKRGQIIFPFVLIVIGIYILLGGL